MKKSAPPLILREKLYIPSVLVNEERLERSFAPYFYDEKACAKCDYLDDRHGYQCEGCPAFLGKIKLWSARTINGQDYIGVPSGELDRIPRRTGISKTDLKRVKDLRVATPMRSKLKFTGSLRDYQRKPVKDFVAAKHGMLSAPPRTGKCLAAGSMVPSSRGLLPIERLVSEGHRGLKVVTKSGIHPVSATYTKTSKLLKLTTANGIALKGTPEHPVLVLNKRLQHVWRRLDKIQPGDFICIQRETGLWASSPAKLEHKLLPERMTIELARLLGYLVANGSLNQTRSSFPHFSFCTKNARVQKDFIRCWNKTFSFRVAFDEQNTPSATCHRMKIRDALEQCGLKFDKSAGKEIPESILRSSKNMILAFLAAYISCDSYIPDDGELELCSASRKLAYQLQSLLLNLGIWSRLETYTSYARNSKAPVEKDYWSLFVSSADKARLLTLLGKGLLKKHVVPNNPRARADGDIVPWVKNLANTEIFSKHLHGGVYTLASGKNQQVLNVRSSLFGSKLNQQQLRIGAINRKVLDQIDLKPYAKISPLFARRLSEIKRLGYRYAEVSSCVRLKGSHKVYDLTVPKNHSFVANGVVVHNTVMGVYTICTYRLRTIVLTSQEDLLRQFLKEFTDHTNLTDIQTTKRPVVGIVRTLEDFDRFDVCLCTYQKLIGPHGRPRLKAIRDKFGLVIVDEFHNASAPEFASVINGLNARHKYGLTATPERKDGRHWIGQSLIGPVVAKSKRKSLTPILYIHQVPVAPPKNRQPVTWNGWSSWWVKNKARNKAVVDLAVRAIKKGRSVLIPAVRVKHIEELTDAINRHFDTKVAESFVGKTKDREKLLNRARSGKVRCVVGMRRIISTGVNVPRWSTLIEAWPISNKPQHYQEILRIATPEEGKPDPVIIHVLSSTGPEFGCFRTCWAIYSKHCSIPDTTRKKAGELLAHRRRDDSVDAEEAEARKSEAAYKPYRLF